MPTMHVAPTSTTHLWDLEKLSVLFLEQPFCPPPRRWCVSGNYREVTSTVTGPEETRPASVYSKDSS